jgi:hypothetical protein
MPMLMDALGWLASIHLGLLFLGLLLVLLLAAELGYRLGSRSRRNRAAKVAAGEQAAEKDSVGFVTAGMLGLLAFLLGVSLSMAQSRYDQRRDVVRDEANAIGTVWLRTGLLGEPKASAMREVMREYAEHRLAALGDSVRSRAFVRDTERANDLHARLWAIVQEAALERPDPTRVAMVVALNDMIDLSLSSRRAFTDQVPIGVFRMLLWATIISVGVVGFNFGLGGYRQPVVTGLLLVFWSSGLVLIVDMNDPLRGAVVVDPAPMVWTIEGFGPPTPAR